QTPLYSITRLAYRPNGRRLIALGEKDGGYEVHGCILDVQTGRMREMGTLSFFSHHRYALAPDGSRVIAVWTEREGDFHAMAFSTDEFRQRQTTLSQTNLGGVYAYAFSPDSKVLAVASNPARYAGS